MLIMPILSRLIEPKAFTNDVLLICVQETHAGFTGHLLNAFQQRGFRTIVRVDHGKLDREAIEASMVVTINLSKDFLVSPPHLDNLSETVDAFSKGRMGRMLLSVFHHVEPSDVRHRTLTDYKKSVEPERLDKWRNALNALTTTHSFGCHFQRHGDTHEYECIENILRKVCEHFASKIGLNPRVKEVIQLLYSKSGDGVHVVGICGDPGIGKKTIARGVYDLIAHEGFDNCCFLHHVGENLREHGLVHLPQMLLSEMVGNLVDTVGHSNIQFGNFEEGMSVIKHTLNQKKVLLILDGINHSDLLKAVVELTDCLGSGSRVIITAQDKCLLESHGIERIYEVKRLDSRLGLQLLRLKVFSSMKISVRYINIIDRAETCASGNPLALEVIGSNLCGKTTEECKSVLDQYERLPNTDLIQNLVRENNRKRLSKDILEENMEYNRRDAQAASNDRSRIWDPMELEFQLCSSTLLDIAL